MSIPNTLTRNPPITLSDPFSPDTNSLGKYLWLDPGAEVIKQHTKAVIEDIVTRYDIDGLHYDDYFYPYPSYNNYEGFPDDATYNGYISAGGTLSRDDWRRENVNELISDTYAIIKAIKPWVTFGVAPFGIWRPNNPPGIVGMDAYEELYADSKKWLNEGWLDYLAPQLYWPIDSTGQPFEPLFDWWNEENTQNKFVIPGLYASAVMEDVKDWPAKEIGDQVELIRSKQLSTSPGEIHFSMQAFQKNVKGLSDYMMNIYHSPTNVPAMPWCGGTRPDPPVLAITDNVITFQSTTNEIRLFSIYDNEKLVARIGHKSDPFTLPADLQHKNVSLYLLGRFCITEREISGRNITK